MAFSTCCDWNDVVYMKCRLLAPLREAAILTTVARPLDNLYAQSRREAHAASVGLFARSFRRERNSAISTRPSASRRSEAVSGVPESWRSSNDVRRRFTPGGSLNPEIPAGMGSSMLIAGFM